MKAKIFYAATFKSLTNQINKSGAALRVDCHFNSHTSNANYSWAKYRTGDRNSAVIANYLNQLTGKNLKIKAKDVASLSSGQRGYPIVRGMRCPAVLWEPCFCSNPAGADAIKNKRNLLHDAFLETINHHLPANALIALVPGHAHKRRGDPGASVLGGGTEAYYTELLCQELFSLIDSKPAKETDDMPAFQAVPTRISQLGDEWWFDNLFTGIGDWNRGRVFMTVRIDPDNIGGKFKHIVIPKDKDKFPNLKWSDPVTIEPDNRPVEIEFPQGLGNFSLHVKSEDRIPILVSVNQMYK